MSSFCTSASDSKSVIPCHSMSFLVIPCHCHKTTKCPHRKLCEHFYIHSILLLFVAEFLSLFDKLLGLGRIF